MTPPPPYPKIFRFYPPSHHVDICLKCESPFQYDITNSHYPSTLTEGISCFFSHSLQGNILRASSQDIHVYSKEFWQQNLVTSKFLLKSFWLTVLFSTSRKQHEYGTHIEKTIHWQLSYGSDVLSETYPPPSPIPKHLEFN